MTLSIGICAALHARGRTVQPFKKGPDYIDPMWLSASAGGRVCRNLDFYTMGRDEISTLFCRSMLGADVGVVEGNKGLHDGVAVDGSNSNAALAVLLGAPVVLVIDVRGMTRGIAPLVLGYQSFEPKVRIHGVILNRVRGARHEGKLRSVLEHYTDVEVLGAVHDDPRLEIVERHLGLIPSNEAGEVAARVGEMGRRIAGDIDLERLLGIAAAAGPVPAMAGSIAHASRPLADVRIAIARDAAFGFYYSDDLEALCAAGAELAPFDTLRDFSLPEADGLFLGGGFPETQMRALEANAALRWAIRNAIEAGLPTYAECGGLMYLSRRLSWHGQTCSMVGILPVEVIMCERPQGRGYVQLEETHEHPWPPQPKRDERRCSIAAHEFHYSRLVGLPGGVTFAYRVTRGTGIDGQNDGIVYKNLLASYVHLRNSSQCRWACRFVDFVRSCRADKGAEKASRSNAAGVAASTAVGEGAACGRGPE
jgi:cobyrinic acid a,c-diamide synthase